MGAVDRDLGALEVPMVPGRGVRDGEAFALVASEIGKLTDIHATSAVDWDVVASRSADILREEGKDLAVAVWLVIAWLRTRGLAGLADGVHVLRDVVTLHWENSTPAPARLRGRRNLIEWLFEKMDECLASEQIDMAPLPSEALAGLVEDWDAIEACWQAYDAEAPSFFGVQRLFKSLPASAGEKADGKIDETPTDQQPVAANAPAQAVSAGGSAGVPVFEAHVAEPVKMAAGADAAQLRGQATQMLQLLGPLLNFCFGNQPTLAFAYRLNCAIAWVLLDAAPASEGGITHVPPPPDVMKDTLARIAVNGEPFAVTQFAQARLTTFPCWLDLCRHTHAALLRAGAAAAAAAVAAETAALVARLPDLPALRFADGMPFADPQTVSWLAALAPRKTGAGQDDEQASEFSLVCDQARARAADGRLDEALDALERIASAATGGRSRFRARLAQCELVRDFGGAGAPSALRFLAAPLVNQIETHCLAQWEPVLAREALALAAAVEHRDAGAAQKRLLSDLAALDFAKAWRLAGMNGSE